MKRVVFVIFQSTNKANGGVESINQILTRLDKIKPIIITQSNEGRTKEWISNNFEVLVWDLKLPKLLKIIVFNLKMFFLLVLKKHVVAVHCNDISAMVHSGLGSFLNLKKVIFNVRDVKTSAKEYGLKWKLASVLASKIVVLSEDMKHKFSSYTNTKSNKILSIYSIVNFKYFLPKGGNPPLVLKNHNTRHAIGVVAAIFSKKQQLKFLKRCSELILSRKDWVFYFIGDFDPVNNEYAKQCKFEVEQNNLNQYVKFTGFQDNMVDWYQSLDINLVVSEREGLARGMIESLSCGTPVISFDVPSAHEILTEYSCGIVVEQGNYESLFHELIKLLNDQSRMDAFSKNCINTTHSLFDEEKVIEGYQNLYIN